MGRFKNDTSNENELDINDETGEILEEETETVESNEKTEKVKEISYKDFLIQVYTELDSINSEDVQQEIDKLKEEVLNIIKEYDKVLKEKDVNALNKLKDQTKENEIRKHHAKTKSIIISTSKFKWEINIWQLLLMGLFAVSIIVLIFLWGFTLK